MRVSRPLRMIRFPCHLHASILPRRRTISNSTLALDSFAPHSARRTPHLSRRRGTNGGKCGRTGAVIVARRKGAGIQVCCVIITAKKVDAIASPIVSLVVAICEGAAARGDLGGERGRGRAHDSGDGLTSEINALPTGNNRT